MNIPFSESLPLDKLTSVFENTSASYKFYWFLAIIELVEEGNTLIPKRKIFSSMINNSWHTVNYFHISFGKQDLIQEAVRTILKIETLTVDENKSKINAVLEKNFININPIWISYLKSNSKLLKDFCYWNLSLFLQKRNPSVHDIPNKINKTLIRNSLTKQNNNYWKLVFNELGSIECIFTGKTLIFEEKKYALDHFVPHAFVSH